MTAALAAFSLQKEIEHYGAYAGIAAVFGLGILSLLYFAQAREVKRLREWAGRPPRRAARPRARGRARGTRHGRCPAPRGAGSGGRSAAHGTGDARRPAGRVAAHAGRRRP